MSRTAVRKAVSGCLEAVLSAGSEADRRAAEQEMKALEVTKGSETLIIMWHYMTSYLSEYGVVLAELMASAEVGVAYRQLASVLLRQYLDCHWSSLADKFSEPLASYEARRVNG